MLAFKQIPGVSTTFRSLKPEYLCALCICCSPLQHNTKYTLFHSLHCLYTKGGEIKECLIQEKTWILHAKENSLQDINIKYLRLFLEYSCCQITLQAKDTKLNILPVSSWTQANDEVHEICYKISFNTAILSNLNGTGNIKSQYLF